MGKNNFKTDQFRRARGGYSRFLRIFCAKCKNFLALYQKDGPGPLKRMYIDRFFSPDKLVAFQNVPLKKIPLFCCEKCTQVLGVPFLYYKEQRQAFRLFVGAVSKKIIKQ